MYVWAVGILAAGQSSTMTGTYAGQFAMEVSVQSNPSARTPWILGSNVHEWQGVLPRGVHDRLREPFCYKFLLFGPISDEKADMNLKGNNSIKTYLLPKVPNL